MPANRDTSGLPTAIGAPTQRPRRWGPPPWTAIAEALAAHDPTDTQTQTDVAVPCAKLGTFDHRVPSNEKRAILLRGWQFLVEIKAQGLLVPDYRTGPSGSGRR